MATDNPIQNIRNYKHGGARDGHKLPEYKAWTDIKRRCHNRAFKHFKHYGGRGISICARWQASFADFLADVGQRPSKKHSIDRIDNDGHYSCGHCEECRRLERPTNCRWATRHEQMRNTRRNNLIAFDGRIRTITDWAKDFHMHPDTLKWRIKNWGIKEAFAMPVDRFHTKPRRR